MQREVLLRVEWKFNQLSLGAEESRLGQDRFGWLGSHPTHPLACVINFTSFPYQIKLQFHIELSSHWATPEALFASSYSRMWMDNRWGFGATIYPPDFLLLPRLLNYSVLRFVSSSSRDSSERSLFPSTHFLRTVSAPKLTICLDYRSSTPQCKPIRLAADGATLFALSFVEPFSRMPMNDERKIEPSCLVRGLLHVFLLQRA